MLLLSGKGKVLDVMREKSHAYCKVAKTCRKSSLCVCDTEKQTVLMLLSQPWLLHG